MTPLSYVREIGNRPRQTMTVPLYVQYMQHSQISTWHEPAHNHYIHAAVDIFLHMFFFFSNYYGELASGAKTVKNVQPCPLSCEIWTARGIGYRSSQGKKKRKKEVWNLQHKRPKSESYTLYGLMSDVLSFFFFFWNNMMSQVSQIGQPSRVLLFISFYFSNYVENYQYICFFTTFNKCDSWGIQFQHTIMNTIADDVKRKSTPSRAHDVCPKASGTNIADFSSANAHYAPGLEGGG